MEAKAKELFYECANKEVDGKFCEFTIYLFEVWWTTTHYPRRDVHLFVYDIEETRWPELSDDATDEEVASYRAEQRKRQTKIARKGLANDHLRKAIGMVDAFLGK